MRLNKADRTATNDVHSRGDHFSDMQGHRPVKPPGRGVGKAIQDGIAEFLCWLYPTGDTHSNTSLTTCETVSLVLVGTHLLNCWRYSSAKPCNRRWWWRQEISGDCTTLFYIWDSSIWTARSQITMFWHVQNMQIHLEAFWLFTVCMTTHTSV